MFCLLVIFAGSFQRRYAFLCLIKFLMLSSMCKSHRSFIGLHNFECISKYSWALLKGFQVKLHLT